MMLTRNPSPAWDLCIARRALFSEGICYATIPDRNLEIATKKNRLRGGRHG